MGSGHGSLTGSGDGSLGGSLGSNSGSGDEDEEEDESRVAVALSPMLGGAIWTTASAACRSMISSTCCTFNRLVHVNTKVNR